MSEGGPAILWFRRDLRLGDHAALRAAAGDGRAVLALYVLDERLLAPSGAPRLAFLHGCLRALSAQLGGRLLVLRGDPAAVVPEAAAAVGAATVHISADAGPYGRERDRTVADALSRQGAELIASGSPYVVAPGEVRKKDGTPYRVFTPFYRSWGERDHPPPVPTDASTVDWLRPESIRRLRPVGIPDGPAIGETRLPEPGEIAATTRWREFLESGIDEYAWRRDRPDLPGTTRLSPYLRWGCVHPRTLLADLREHHGAGAAALRGELAWREFHADVLWNWPHTARGNFDRRFDAMSYESGEQAREWFAAWCTGRTGYPIVDAGMRELLAEGWLHNRVRMIAASFLVKDLHLPWWWGARHFLRHLVDGDLASNQLNWQWVAGSGTDAAPYFRVFNPTRQGEKFDPDGDYVRQFVPELRGLPGKSVHRPEGRAAGYPAPLVEHAEERQVALGRYGAISGQPRGR